MIPDSQAPLSAVVVQAVADAEGVDPIELQRPLYEAIDPDALDALFGGSDPDATTLPGRVEFAYHGYTVVARSDGTVLIQPGPTNQHPSARGTSVD